MSGRLPGDPDLEHITRVTSNDADIGDRECRDDYVEILGGRGATSEIPHIIRDRCGDMIPVK